MSDPARAPVFQLAGAGYRYPEGPEPALDGIELEIGAGAFTAVVGPNGAGKSTLVRLLGGTLSPTSGTVACLGRSLDRWHRTDLARRLAVVSQEPPPQGLPMTVRGYVELGRNPYVSPWAALREGDRRIVAQALARTSLTGLAARSLTELSGGERQRAKLARALAQEPEILVLDEPSAHLDFRHALWVFDALHTLVREEGVTVVCITHDLHLASRYAERLVLLVGGRLAAADRPGALLTSPELALAYECEVRVEALGELGHYVLPVRAAPDAGRVPS